MTQLLPAGLSVLQAWGFDYKTNLIWHKVRKDGGSDGRGVGFYFRNVTEVVLFGVRGKSARTLSPGRSQVNLSKLIATGFDVETRSHAFTVLTRDFSKPLTEMCDELLSFRIFDAELIQGGGGEVRFTQRLRNSLSGRGWHKRNIVIRKTVDGHERSAISHEIDYVRCTDCGCVALEIEWNNKDPFLTATWRIFSVCITKAP